LLARLACASPRSSGLGACPGSAGVSPNYLFFSPALLTAFLYSALAVNPAPWAFDFASYQPLPGIRVLSFLYPRTRPSRKAPPFRARR